MFLEAQFGQSIEVIDKPRIKQEKKESNNGIKVEPEEEAMSIEELEAEELERLQSIGILVPGLEVRVDDKVAIIWLEHLEVECSYGVLRDRVKAVVERAVETIAPLWGRNTH